MNVYFIAIIIALLWGIRPVLQKHLLGNISPDTVMIIGGVLYFILVFLYGIFHRKRVLDEISKIDNQQAGIFLAISFVGFFASVLYYNLLAKEKASMIVTITSIWPIFAIIFANILLSESINLYLILGLLSILFIVNNI